MESLSISLSFPLAKLVESSIIVVDQRADSRVVDSGGNSLVGNSRGRDSLIGDSRGYSLVGNSRGSNSVAVGNSRSSNSVDSSVVSKGECVVEKGISISISLSLSFPLHNMLDSSVLSNVLGAKDTVRDSSVVLRVVVVGDGVSGDLGLGIDHRADSGVVDSRGGDSVVGDSRDCSLVGDSGNCSLDKRGSH